MRVLGYMRDDLGLALIIDKSSELQYYRTSTISKELLANIENWIKDPDNWEPPVFDL